jgi:hypothetical protein
MVGVDGEGTAWAAADINDGLGERGLLRAPNDDDRQLEPAGASPGAKALAPFGPVHGLALNGFRDGFWREQLIMAAGKGGMDALLIGCPPVAVSTINAQYCCINSQF